MPGGAFTSAVKALQAGDSILLEQAPNGFMAPDRFVDGDSLWMLASGTGLGPYISMLCGNPAMIEDTRRLLRERGFRPCRRALPGQFVTENYW